MFVINSLIMYDCLVEAVVTMYGSSFKISNVT